MKNTSTKFFINLPKFAGLKKIAINQLSAASEQLSASSQELSKGANEHARE